MGFCSVRKMIWTMSAFCRKETLLVVSGGLAALSCLLVRPDRLYLSYPDYRVLALLFSLMLVIAGWQELGFFRWLGAALSRRVGTVRGLLWVLCGLCFFGSMLMTNDVALITFVPFTIALLCRSGAERQLISALVIETVAANLGSMLTPVGNPQNLYLYSLSEMDPVVFLLHMLPIWAVSLVIVCGMILLQKNSPLTAAEPQQPAHRSVVRSWRFWVFAGLFAFCLAGVLRFLPYWAVLVGASVVVLLLNRRLFSCVNYSLLVTFLFFFILIGNLGRVEAIRTFLSSAIAGNELWFGVGLSQIISNVPAAMLLAGFSTEYKALLWGVNIGGLGTLIASMASLISYQFYAAVPGAKKGRYLLQFTCFNFAALAVLTLAAVVFSAFC